MRWIKPDYDTRRIITKFLWFPIQIGKETRWLEKATIEQCYIEGEPYDDDRWQSIKWIETESNKKFIKKSCCFS